MERPTARGGHDGLARARVLPGWLLRVLVAVWIASSADVRAQTPGSAVSGGSSRSDRGESGSGPDALPGVHEVPFAVPAEPGVRARAGVGYGWTESVLDADDVHHRLQLDAAVSLAPAPRLAASLRVLGRADLHAADGGESESGVITETHLLGRVNLPLTADLHGGAQLELWLPAGDSVGDAFAAVSGEFQLLLAYRPGDTPWTLGLALGVRLDRSTHAGGDPELLSAADRLALGVSEDPWAMRQGLALAYRAGPLEWVLEWASRLYFGHLGESPMWIRAGARHHPTEQLQLELLLGVSPSPRPSFAGGAAEVPVEPRLWAGLSARMSWPFAKPARSRLPASPPGPDADADADADVDVQGQVFAPGGAVLPGAVVTLAREGQEPARTVSDDTGGFAFTSLPAGRYALAVTAPGFLPHEQELSLEPADAAALTIALDRELPNAQIRGTVRRFDGRPIRASVAIPELSITTQTRDDGSFEIDVQPGEYSIEIAAPGLRRQTRRTRVDLNGVAILIVELEPSR